MCDYQPDFYCSILSDGAFLARRFEKSYRQSFLYALIEQRETEMLKEYLCSVRSFDETFHFALFYLCAKKDYEYIQILLEENVSCNTVFLCPGDHGENKVTAFLFFCATVETEQTDAYEQTLSVFLRKGACNGAEYSGFYVDGPGIAGTYQQFSYSLENLARDKERFDDGALYRALFG